MKSEPKDPCPANATWIVFRGKKRLFLCDEHRPTYTGSGKVATYGWPDSDADFTGDTRRCGEAVG